MAVDRRMDSTGDYVLRTPEAKRLLAFKRNNVKRRYAMVQRIVLFALLLGPALLAGCTSGTVRYKHPSRDCAEAQRTTEYRSLRIPPGHLPPPGSCRIWFPGRPPGKQPPPGDCATLAHQVPAGAWLLHRPPDDPAFVEVSVYEGRKTGFVVEVRVYDAETGRFIGFRGETARR